VVYCSNTCSFLASSLVSCFQQKAGLERDNTALLDAVRAREATIMTLEGSAHARDQELELAREKAGTAAALEIDLRNLEDKERTHNHQLAEAQASVAASQSAALHAEALRQQEDHTSKGKLQVIQKKYASFREQAAETEAERDALQQQLQQLRTAHSEELQVLRSTHGDEVQLLRGQLQEEKRKLQAKSAEYDRVNDMLEREQCDRAEASAELKRLQGHHAAKLKVP
jgi:chromosome segregation ATPase